MFQKGKRDELSCSRKVKQFLFQKGKGDEFLVLRKGKGDELMCARKIKRMNSGVAES